ncbi:hypothetical protein [Aureliella helgolandensis]|uniref:Phage-related minor tail protein n=1 Tax=Aureliella helgolandensis TaxID=2527968 RepID=A0A518G2U0_9BACT|nr:hypothetical protein [Aureliella helgolandensis]QDV22927.1 hypothetical protein Q31a_12200 [Aureliella helgolandensis]
MATQIVELTGDEAKLLKSLDNVIQKQLELERKLRDTGVQGDAAGIQMKDALAKVEAEAEKTLKGLLKELNTLGPEGRQASEELRKHLVEAGKIGEKSIESVVAKLDLIDPESAAAARKLVSNMQDAGNKGESIFQRFGKSAVGQIAGIASAYVGVSEAIQAVNGYLKQQRDLLKEAKDAQIALARSQQDFHKNSVGLTAIQQSELLKVEIPNIARDAGFPDVSSLNDAVGATVSVGADEKQVVAAVRAAASLTTNSPEALDDLSAAAHTVGRYTGTNDPIQGLNLLLTAGNISAVKDPAKLAEQLPKLFAISAAASEAAPEVKVRETAALFGSLTKQLNDKTGDISATALRDLEPQLRAFAKDKVDDPGSTLGRLELLRNSSKEIQEKFLSSVLGGGAAKIAVESLLDPTSELSRNVASGVESVSLGRGEYDKVVGQIHGATSPLAIASAENRSKAAFNAKNLEDTEGATLDLIREITSETLGKTLPAGIDGFLAARGDFSAYGGLTGSTAAEEGASAVRTLLLRAGRLRGDGIQAGDETKLVLIDQQVKNIEQVLAAQGGIGALDSGGVQTALERQRSAVANAGTVRERFADEEFNAGMKRMVESIAASNEAMQDQPEAPPANPQPATGAVNNLQP